MEGEEAVVDGAAVMGEGNNDAHERAANRAPPRHPRVGGDPGGDLAADPKHGHHSLTLLTRLNNVNPIDSPITMKEPAWN